MALINQPPISSAATDKNGVLVQGWASFFAAVFRLLSALTASGATAARPTTFLWAGRPYFDTTLGYPVWWDGGQWVDSTGAPA